MSVIIILLGASLLVALFFLGAFIWSVKSGQHEDLYSPAHRILFDNTPAETPGCKSGKKCNQLSCHSHNCNN
jgi:cbb3-type cytochrome oxidase maturation protein